MRKWSQIAVTSVVALALASPAFAQSGTTAPTTGADSSMSSGTTQSGQTSTSNSATPTPGTGAASGGGVIAEQQSGQTMSSDIVGMKVMGAGEESIGEVSDLLIEDGQLVGAVMNVGGFLGLGAKKVAVPWDQLSVSEVEGSMVATVDLSKDQLASMPEFKTETEAMAEESRSTATGGTSTQ